MLQRGGSFSGETSPENVPWEPPPVATTVKARRGKLPPTDFGGTPTPGPYGGKPLRVCAERTPEGERQMPAEGDPPAALVSPPAGLAPQGAGSPPAGLAPLQYMCISLN
ncbi:hypothetical protein [Brasilonema sennae]|uniref:hypothetical protein n=1 Tax=Brasilonema sennae TaxID=1397703 RepID=UPI0030DB1FAF